MRPQLDDGCARRLAPQRSFEEAVRGGSEAQLRHGQAATVLSGSRARGAGVVGMRTAAREHDERSCDDDPAPIARREHLQAAGAMQQAASAAVMQFGQLPHSSSVRRSRYRAPRARPRGPQTCVSNRVACAPGQAARAADMRQQPCGLRPQARPRGAVDTRPVNARRAPLGQAARCCGHASCKRTARAPRPGRAGRRHTSATVWLVPPSQAHRVVQTSS